MTLVKDPLLLYPMVMRIQTAHGLVDLNDRLPERGGVTLRQVDADEVQATAKRLGLVLKDPASCTADSLIGPVGPAGMVLRIATTLGAEYARIRPIQLLRIGELVGVTEAFSDRYTLRHWQNAIVQTQPETPFYQHAQGTEFHNIVLELLIVGGTP